MRTLLHILTRPQDELAGDTIERQRAFPDTTVEVVDLANRDPDYDALVERIFAAQSVEVW